MQRAYTRLRPSVHFRVRYNLPVTELELLHDEIRACRRCEADGFPISPPPLVWGQAPAPFLLVGQAPGLSDCAGSGCISARPPAN